MMDISFYKHTLGEYKEISEYDFIIEFHKYMTFGNGDSKSNLIDFINAIRMCISYCFIEEDHIRDSMIVDNTIVRLLSIHPKINYSNEYMIEVLYDISKKQGILKLYNPEYEYSLVYQLPTGRSDLNNCYEFANTLSAISSNKYFLKENLYHSIQEYIEKVQS